MTLVRCLKLDTYSQSAREFSVCLPKRQKNWIGSTALQPSSLAAWGKGIAEAIPYLCSMECLVCNSTKAHKSPWDLAYSVGFTFTCARRRTVICSPLLRALGTKLFSFAYPEGALEGSPPLCKIVLLLHKGSCSEVCTIDVSPRN